MDLLVTQLKTAIRNLLDAKGIRARVLDKINRHGEIVIGIVLDEKPGLEPRPREPRAPAPLPDPGPTSEVREERTVDASHAEAAEREP